MGRDALPERPPCVAKSAKIVARVTSSTFEEVGEESIGSASCLDLSSRARPGGADIRGGAAVSRVLSPDGEAPTASIA